MTLCWRLWTSSLSPKATLATELASVALKNKSAFFSRMSITQGLSQGNRVLTEEYL